MEDIVLRILTEIRPDCDFTESEDFIEDGLLDSFDMVSLVDSLEEEFDVVIGANEMLPENFCSLSAISSTVERNKK